MASTVSSPSAPMFAISDCHGVVIQHSVTWKTHVTGGGGGGFLVVNNGNGYGQVNPRWTRTDHVHRQDFWVRTSPRVGRSTIGWKALRTSPSAKGTSLRCSSPTATSLKSSTTRHGCATAWRRSVISSPKGRP